MVTTNSVSSISSLSINEATNLSSVLSLLLVLQSKHNILHKTYLGISFSEFLRLMYSDPVPWIWVTVIVALVL